MTKLTSISIATAGSTATAVGGSYALQIGSSGVGNESVEGEQSLKTSINATVENQSLKPEDTNNDGVQSEIVSNPLETQSPVSSPEASSTPPKQVSEKKLKFKTLQEFKDSRGYKCSESIFSGKDLKVDDLSSAGDLSQADNFFGSPTSDKSKIQSCLVINGEKNIYDDDKWSGTFTWTGSLESDGKGFVIVNIAKAENSGKLNLTGGVYLLEKESEEETGSIKYKKEQESPKELTSSDSEFNKKLPKVESGSEVTAGTGSYWGFIKDNNDLPNICDSTSCLTTVKDTKNELEAFEGTLKDDADKSILKGTKNLGGLDYMYEDKSNNFNLKDKLKGNLESVKGTWNKVSQSADQ